MFSRFEQQIVFLEKLAETTEPTTDRHGHDRPSRVSRFKTIIILNFGYLNRLSELRDEVAGWTVTDPLVKIESLNSVTTQQDGPSQARRPVTGYVTLTGSVFC